MYDSILERLKGLHPRLIDLALDRIELLLDALGSPHKNLPPVIHIAGTNGKGSTLAYLRAIAEAAGLRAHVYISPHLVRFNERIRIAGKLIEDAELAAILRDCESANKGRPITFFEITTAAAFLAFARHPAELCLLETGLGGRCDATNVIARPALTLITPVSYDHQNFLGDTLTQIAGEKAGILKPGVPCVVAPQERESLDVIVRQADEIGAPLFIAGKGWRVMERPNGIRVEMGSRTLDLPRPALVGAHQIGNAGQAAVGALLLNECRPHSPFTAASIGTGIARAEWPARLQRLRRGALVGMLPPGWELWLDGGHNPSAGQALAAMAEDWSDLPLDLVMGMLDSKDEAGFMRPLADKVRGLRAVTIPNEAHARSAEQLTETALSCGISAKPARDVESALMELVQAPGPARVLICGSLYLAGSVLAMNG